MQQGPPWVDLGAAARSGEEGTLLVGGETRRRIRPQCLAARKVAAARAVLKALARLNYTRPRSGFGRVTRPTMPDPSAGTGASRHFLLRFPSRSFAAFLVLTLAPAAVLAGSLATKRQMEFGVEMALKGSWREAAFRFERVVRDEPGNAAAWSNLGVARESTARFEEALEAYERALELDPGNDRIQENLDRLKAYMATLGQPGFPSAAQESGKTEAGADQPPTEGRKDDGS